MSITKPQKKPKIITAEELDEMFDRGDDISEYLDYSTAKMHYPVKRITIDFPLDILNALDIEAEKIGVPRTSLIKLWVAEQLKLQQKK